MPFGLKGAPAAFQRRMDEILLTEENSNAYIDDVSILGKDWEQHKDELRGTLQRLRERGQTCKLAKCKFGRRKVDFLGHTIGKGLISPQEAKVAALLAKRRPTTKKELQSYLSSTGYYRRFIQGYSGVAAPLTDLTANKKPDHLDWQPQHQQAFYELRLSTAPVLVAPDHNRRFQLSTDASKIAIGAVLEQEHAGMMAYFSRKLLPRESNYPITELEALAIVEAVQHFNVYLIANSFTVVTDHRALVYLNQMNNGSIRLTRWSHALQLYDCTFVYRKETENHVADYLSRASDAEDDSGSTGRQTRTSGQEKGGCVVPTSPHTHTTHTIRCR